MQQHFNYFKEKLHSMAALSAKDWSYIQPKLSFNKYTAGQVISDPGGNNHYFIFVCEGLFRETAVNNFGELSIRRYLDAGSVSINIDTLSQVTLEAINDCAVFILTERDVYKLEKKHKMFRKHFRLFLVQYTKHLLLRADILGTRPGPLKYARFYARYPAVCIQQDLFEQSRFLAATKDTVYLWRAKHKP